MPPGQQFPCPCCGYLVFEREPGSSQICPICGWEDDLAQLRFPRMPGGSNGVSLMEAQENFHTYGACERRSVPRARPPRADDRVEGGWRRLNPARDNIEEPTRGIRYGDSYPWADTTVLYYWRASYWRRLAS